MKKLFLLTFVFVLILAGCSCEKAEPTDSITADKMSELYEEYNVMAGTWQGQWKNTTFGSSGASKATVIVNEDGTASFTIDIDGMVFGMVNPDPKTFRGNFNDKGIVITQKDDLFGDVTITIVKTGESEATVNVKSENITTPGIKSMTANGTLDAEKIHMDYEVQFTAGNPAKGVFDMTKID